MPEISGCIPSIKVPGVRDIYVLEKGKVSEIGSHQELLQNKGLYYAMWRQQVGERRQLVFETNP